MVAFWKDAALVKPIDTHRCGEVVLRDLLRIPARGLTNVAFGLEIGLRELRRARARTRIGILLSDAVHNAGPDPRDVAPGFERLHVLLETDGEHDEQLARELARGGHGEVAPIANFTQVPAALNTCSAPDPTADRWSVHRRNLTRRPVAARAYGRRRPEPTRPRPSHHGDGTPSIRHRRTAPVARVSSRERSRS